MRWRRGRLNPSLRGALATKQSSFFVTAKQAGLLRFARNDGESVILQQPLDVIELDLRTGGIGQAPAQLFQNPAHPLHVHLAGNFDRVVVAELTPVQRPAKRIAAPGRALLAAGAIAGAVLPLAFALLHAFGQALSALAQRLERPALRIHRAIGVPLAEPAAGIAHRAVGLAETILAVALIALLALLTLFAALA